MMSDDKCPCCGEWNPYATPKMGTDRGDVAYACGTWVVDGEVRQGVVCLNGCRLHKQNEAMRAELARREAAANG